MLAQLLALPLSSLAIALNLLASGLPAAVHAVQLPLRPLAASDISALPTILDDSFDEWLSNLTSVWGMKGLSIAVVRKKDDGKWDVETKGFGVKDARGHAATDETRFAIGSNSKLFATLALGSLVEGGYKISPNSSVPLEWTTKVATILGDDWQLEDKIAESHADLVDILSHQTGLPRHDLGWRKNMTTRDATKQLRYLRPSTEFRKTFQYNNWMYMVVAEIVERVSGRSFEAYAQDMIDRLPLPSTTYNGTSAMLSGDLATGFVRIRANVSGSRGQGPMKYEYAPTEFFLNDDRHELIIGAGGISMNAKDVAKWLQTLLLWGKHPETHEQVIPEAAVVRAAFGSSVESGFATYPEVSVATYGGGQGAYAYQGHNMIEHNGGWAGWLSVISRAPQDGVGVAVLTNWDEGGMAMEIIKYYLYEKIFNLPHVDWSSRYLARLHPSKAPEPSMAAFAQSTNQQVLPLESIRGLYSHPAYGDYLFCPPPSSTPLPACAQADSYWHAVSKANLSLSPAGVSPSLSASIPSDLANYVQLFPVPGSSTAFKMVLIEVTSTPSYTGDEVETVVHPTSEFFEGREEIVEFVSDEEGNVEGFALFGIWGAVAGTPPLKGATVRERAEVWFEKID